MASDAQKKANLKYEQSKKCKATRTRYHQSKGGKAGHVRRSARYYQTEKGKVMKARMHAKRERDLGYKPINDWFPGSNGHHIDKENVLFIPAELHRSIKHAQSDPASMKLINDAAFEWFYIEEVI